VKRYACPACNALAGGNLAGYTQPGLGALTNAHRKLVQVSAECSANIDDSTIPFARNHEKVFDYILVAKGTCDVHVIEVHSAGSTHKVTELIGKKAGTSLRLTRAGVALSAKAWHWIVDPTAKGGICFKANDKYGKRLQAAGIRQPVKSLAQF